MSDEELFLRATADNWQGTAAGRALEKGLAEIARLKAAQSGTKALVDRLRARNRKLVEVCKAYLFDLEEDGSAALAGEVRAAIEENDDGK